jgi:hypothetical protein
VAGDTLLFNNYPACVLSLSFSFLRLLSFAQKVTMAILALYSPMISPPADLRLSAPPSRPTVYCVASDRGHLPLCTLGGDCCAYATGASRLLSALHNRHIAGAVRANTLGRSLLTDLHGQLRKKGRRLIHHAKLTRQGAERSKGMHGR